MDWNTLQGIALDFYTGLLLLGAACTACLLVGVGAAKVLVRYDKKQQRQRAHDR